MGDYQFLTAVPRLAVGAALQASDVDALVQAGVTHVVDVTLHDDSPFLAASQAHPLIDCLWLDTGDDGQPKGTVYAQMVPWLEQRWWLPGTRFLFHCDGGVNRGPSACYLALRLLGWPGADAASAIRAVRPQVQLRYAPDADQLVQNLRL